MSADTPVDEPVEEETSAPPETDPVCVGEWVISVVDGQSRYGVVHALDGDEALVKTRDDNDEFIRVPVASLTHSESGHR